MYKIYAWDTLQEDASLGNYSETGQRIPTDRLSLRLSSLPALPLVPSPPLSHFCLDYSFYSFR
jgi:hypothetical protein